MEKQHPLISVIVPIYNVEKYVRKCLDSLKGQTRREIEVICIDDGSTDESGRIADDYVSEEFPTFRVIHTENRGLSAARNRGLDEARSDWIMFVDSDDWVSSEFCRIPYEAAIKYGADMVAFQSYDTTENGRVKLKAKLAIPRGIINHEKAIDLNGAAVWRKLYKKKLFDTIRFPEGRVYEDVATTHKLIYKSERIFSIQDSLYFRRVRKESISHTVQLDKERYEMVKLRYQELVEFGYPEEKAQAMFIGESLRIYGRMRDSENSIYTEIEGNLERVKGIPMKLSNEDRFKMALWRMNKYLYRSLYRTVTRCMVR